MNDDSSYWVEAWSETDSRFVPQLEEIFYSLDALSVSVYDAGDQPILEPSVNEIPLWDRSRVVALFAVEPHADTKQTTTALERKLALALENAPAFPLDAFQFHILENQDWVRASLDTFKPIRFANGLAIVPSWESSACIADDVNVLLDPGLAFGTGSHATTYLCLAALDRNPPEANRVIDFGCGSGVLGIAALRLGATKVAFVDNDPQALTASSQNLALNGLAEEKSWLLINSSTEDTLEQFRQEPVELILANILAATLEQYFGLLSDLVRPGGRVILSGILEKQSASVIKSYSTSFENFSVSQRDEWVCIEATRKQ